MDSEDPYSQTSTNKPDFVDKVETLSAVQQHWEEFWLNLIKPKRVDKGIQI